MAPRQQRPEWEQLPTTVEGWGGHQTPMTVDTRKRRDPRDMLQSIFGKTVVNAPLDPVHHEMIPLSAMPEAIRKAASEALTTDKAVPRGYNLSDFKDPEERAMLERLVAVGARERELATKQAEQEAEAKLQQDAAMRAKAGLP